ncbi:hypothetical protein IAT38_000383 [Cryptococcus sp. DSM 104549]
MTTVVLNEAETKFVKLLDRFATGLAQPVECRIAGGWLLSLPSNDLDIALTIPSGHSFAVDFVEFLKANGEQTGSVGKVAANPEQSKHLETGTTRILGLECDFVGLRSETYTDTRIPQVKPGTPLEDATRRDLTINALFYNVHSKAIEDLTGKGLSDLATGIARTPLPPRQTFQDDPLRIIRCVRFASRFSLSIADDVIEAIKDEAVKAAIHTKVSKERIGIEVNKMLHHNPFHAMTLINSLGLHPYIFTCEVDTPRHEAFATAQILDHISHNGWDVDEMMWLASAAVPFRDLRVKRKGKDTPAVSVVLSGDARNTVTNLFEAAHMINPEATGRSEIGTVLQHSSVKPWERSLTWAMVMNILPTWTGVWDDKAEAVARRYTEFKNRIAALRLHAAIQQPVLLNGNEIQDILSLRPSRLLMIIREAINIWQLDHPEGTKEECVVWLKQQWDGAGKSEWEAMAQPPNNAPASKKAGLKGEKRKR